MNLHGFELEDRIGALLEAQLACARGPQLAGIGKKLKKLAKKVGKVVRKVAPIALGGAALYFGGKALAGVFSKSKAVAPEAASAVGQAVDSGALAAPPAPAAAPPPTTSQVVLDTAAQIAQSYIAAQGAPSAMAMPGMQPIITDALAAQARLADPYRAIPAPGSTQGEVQAAAPSMAMPKWLLPALGVGGAALAVVVLARPQRSDR